MWKKNGARRRDLQLGKVVIKGRVLLNGKISHFLKGRVEDRVVKSVLLRSLVRAAQSEEEVDHFFRTATLSFRDILSHRGCKLGFPREKSQQPRGARARAEGGAYRGAFLCWVAVPEERVPELVPRPRIGV